MVNNSKMNFDYVFNSIIAVPSKVQDLKYKILNVSTVCIRWRAPLHRNGKLLYYFFSYTSDKNEPLESWSSLNISISQRKFQVCKFIFTFLLLTYCYFRPAG